MHCYQHLQLLTPSQWQVAGACTSSSLHKPFLFVSLTLPLGSSRTLPCNDRQQSDHVQIPDTRESALVFQSVMTQAKQQTHQKAPRLSQPSVAANGSIVTCTHKRSHLGATKAQLASLAGGERDS